MNFSKHFFVVFESIELKIFLMSGTMEFSMNPFFVPWHLSKYGMSVAAEPVLSATAKCIRP